MTTITHYTYAAHPLSFSSLNTLVEKKSRNALVFSSRSIPFHAAFGVFIKRAGEVSGYAWHFVCNAMFQGYSGSMVLVTLPPFRYFPLAKFSRFCSRTTN